MSEGQDYLTDQIELFILNTYGWLGTARMVAGLLEVDQDYFDAFGHKAIKDNDLVSSKDAQRALDTFGDKMDAQQAEWFSDLLNLQDDLPEVDAQEALQDWITEMVDQIELKNDLLQALLNCAVYHIDWSSVYERIKDR